MSAIASQITRLKIVYSTVYPDADQRKHQSSASDWPLCGVNSLHKKPVMRKMFPFDDVIMVDMSDEVGNSDMRQATNHSSKS